MSGPTKPGIALAGLYNLAIDELPKVAREIVEAHAHFFAPIGWDALSPWQRRFVVTKVIDPQRPANPVEREAARVGLREGFRRADEPRRKRRRAAANRRVASRPRLSRQKVSNDAIRRVHEELLRNDVKPTAAKAYHRLFPKTPPLTLRGFRLRWNALYPKKGS